MDFSGIEDRSLLVSAKSEGKDEVKDKDIKRDNAHRQKQENFEEYYKRTVETLGLKPIAKEFEFLYAEYQQLTSLQRHQNKKEISMGDFFQEKVESLSSLHTDIIVFPDYYNQAREALGLPGFEDIDRQNYIDPTHKPVDSSVNLTSLVAGAGATKEHGGLVLENESRGTEITKVSNENNALAKKMRQDCNAGDRNDSEDLRQAERALSAGENKLQELKTTYEETRARLMELDKIRNRIEDYINVVTPYVKSKFYTPEFFALQQKEYEKQEKKQKTNGGIVLGDRIEQNKDLTLEAYMEEYIIKERFMKAMMAAQMDLEGSNSFSAAKSEYKDFTKQKDMSPDEYVARFKFNQVFDKKFKDWGLNERSQKSPQRKKALDAFLTSAGKSKDAIPTKAELENFF